MQRAERKIEDRHTDSNIQKPEIKETDTDSET